MPCTAITLDQLDDSTIPVDHKLYRHLGRLARQCRNSSGKRPVCRVVAGDELGGDEPTFVGTRLEGDALELVVDNFHSDDLILK